MKKILFLLLLVFIVAGCSPKEKFTVVFLNHDDTVLKEEIVEYGDDATPPEVPAREGYTFQGWNKSFTNVMSNLEVKALFSLNRYTVNFYDHDGNLLKTETVDYNTEVTPPELPPREGYRFIGWDHDLVIKNDVNINPQYEKIKYTVNFYDENNKLIESQIVEHGKTAIPPKAPTKEGYIFVGWYSDLDNITSDLHVYPKFEIKTYEVVFKDYDDSVIATTEVKHGDNVTIPKEPLRNGYKFAGWDHDLTNITSNLTVTAKYDLVEYQIDFIETLPRKDVKWDSKEDFIFEFNKDFHEWLKSRINIIDGLTKTNDTYQLTRNNQTVTWTDAESLLEIGIYEYEKTLGNLIYKPIKRENFSSIEIDDNFFLNTEPYRSKYLALDKYFLNVMEKSYTSYDRGYNPKSDGKVQIFFRFQQWMKGTRIPAFDELPTKNVPDIPKGVSLKLPTPINYTITEEVELPEPTFEGLIFLGWYDNPYGSGEPLTKIDQGNFGNLVLYAKVDLDPDIHHVIFIDNGKVLSEQYYKDGDTLEIPDPNPKAGYEFIGWDKDLNNITSDITFTAQYDPIVYTITYHANIDKKVTLPTKPITYTILDQFTLPEISCEGYLFVGWYDNPDGEGDVIIKTTYGNKELYARWLAPDEYDNGDIYLVAHEVEIEVGQSSRVYTKLNEKYFSPDTVIFLSSNPEIASVDETGFIIGKQLGSTSIVAIMGQETTSLEIKVVEREYEVKWVGHQGSGGPVVQNTVSAFEEGGKRGYYAMECDVRVSKDGVYYICHDDVFLPSLFVDESLHGELMSGYTWEELKTYQVKDTYQGKTYYGYLTTVEEYLKICKKYGAKPVLELKWTTGINNNNQSKLKGLVELTQKVGVYEDAIFLSSMKNCLTYIREHFPDANIQFLSGSTTTTKENIEWCIENRFSIDASHQSVNAELVSLMHEAGLYVNAYTVNNENDAKRLQELGVDMITTDNLGIK